MSIVTLFLVEQKWKPSESPQTDKWINRACYIH